jgi:hypothetical protein
MKVKPAKHSRDVVLEMNRGEEPLLSGIGTRF